MLNILFIALGGALGATSRYGMYNLSSQLLPLNFPYGTLLVNAIGSFIIGFAMLSITNSLHFVQPLRLFIIIGFCGSFTTFSAFSMDNFHLLQTQQYAIAALNIFANVVLCLITVFLGMLVASKV